MNNHLSHSSKLIYIKEIMKEVLPSLNDLSKKRITEEVETLEKSWHDLGDQISEMEQEARRLFRTTNDVLELISECNNKLSMLESELNSIQLDSAISDFEKFQKHLCVSIFMGFFLSFLCTDLIFLSLIS